jgi:Flp pilus assembly CpaE family ATPase
MAAKLGGLLASQAPAAHVSQINGQAALEARLDRPGAQLPAACFLEIAAPAAAALALLARLTGPAFRIPTVVVLPQENHEVALRSLRTVACGCLVHPVDADQLLPVLPRLGCLPQPGAGRGTGRVVCVMPARGSSGASTAAATLAFHAARTGAGPVLLADMDLLAGTLGFMLKLSSRHSFVDALSHAAALDADLWKGLATPYRGVDVLLSPEDPVGCELDVAGVARLIEYVRGAYGLAVVDTGGVFSPLGLELARLSDDILLVTTSDVGIVHGAARSLSYLQMEGCRSEAVKVAVSRWRREAGLDREAIESALGQEVCCVLPHDPQATEDALLEGRPVAPASALGRGVAELASRLLDRGPAASKAPQFRSWRSLFSRAG